MELPKDTICNICKNLIRLKYRHTRDTNISEKEQMIERRCIFGIPLSYSEEITECSHYDK